MDRESTCAWTDFQNLIGICELKELADALTDARIMQKILAKGFF